MHSSKVLVIVLEPKKLDKSNAFRMVKLSANLSYFGFRYDGRRTLLQAVILRLNITRRY